MNQDPAINSASQSNEQNDNQNNNLDALDDDGVEVLEDNLDL